MIKFVNGALGDNEIACTTEATGGGDNKSQGKLHGNGGKESDERWWSQLCANKHLTEDETFKRVRKQNIRNYDVDRLFHAVRTSRMVSTCPLSITNLAAGVRARQCPLLVFLTLRGSHLIIPRS